MLSSALQQAEEQVSYQCFTQIVADQYGWNVDCCYANGTLVSDLNFWHLSGFARRYFYSAVNFVVSKLEVHLFDELNQV